MGIIKSGDNKIKLMSGDVKVKRAYAGDVKIYSAGNIVTYYIDADTLYQEEVDEGASCLSPKTFTPTKSGWEFAGWRQDTEANGSVLSSLTMGDAPITLYAVFRQTITLSYNGNSATSGSTAAQTGYRYYNNDNMANPSFTLRSNGFSRSGYTFTKWALGSASGTQYAEGASVTLAANTTMYAVWKASSVVVTGNSNYLTISGAASERTDLGCGIWYGNGEVSNTATLTVNYSGYNKITIAFTIRLNQVAADDKGIVKINGVTVVNTKSSIYPTWISGGNGDNTYRYTATYTGINKISVSSSCENYAGTGTWTDIAISIYSATLSM